jgi:hypothetical protein
MIIIIVDPQHDRETGEIINTPSKRSYILTLKESAINPRANQGREIIDRGLLPNVQVQG